MKTTTFFITAWLIALSACGAALAASPGRVTFDGKCLGGLHDQPGQIFTVFVFCDPPLGTNIGVILKDLSGEFDSKKWWPTNRFWQDHAWAADVTSFAWDPSGPGLFVGTSSTYGTGAVYRLDLSKRTYEPVFRIDDLDQSLVARERSALKAESHDAIVESVDTAKRTVTLAIRMWYGDGQTKVIGRKVLPLGRGPRSGGGR